MIRIEGALDDEGAAELRRECRSAPPAVRLDLSGLRSATPPGIEILRSLEADGAVLAGASPYILLLLEGGDAVTSEGPVTSRPQPRSALVRTTR